MRLRKTADIYSADDVNLLINGSQYLSHALVDLSAFVNVLSYEVHTLWEFRHVRTGWTRSPSDLGRSFNRCRDIALDGEWSVNGTLLSELDLRSVDLLRYLCGTPMSLGWYYALTPVKPVTISNEHCS